MDLSDNEIECLQNLNHLRLKTLNVENNKLFSYEEGDHVGLKTLEDLQSINLNYNELESLSLLKGVDNLQEINMRGNNVGQLMELTHLRDLRYLTKVDFRDNPMNAEHNYLRACLDCMRHVCILDGNVVDAAEKVIS